MKGAGAVFRRELMGYFATPIAYVFFCIYLLAASLLTFYWGNWFEQARADLGQFFAFHPWLYMFLIPALAMRLWAEEYKTGTVEFLMTLPVPVSALVIGKFLAAWLFAGIALALTFPMWLTTAYLGDPDHGVIFASYIGSFLMAGSYLAVGACLSALTNNQVIAFVLAAGLAFLLTIAGLPLVVNALAGLLPAPIVEAIAGFSFLAHFQAIRSGVLDLRDLIFFASIIVVFLGITISLVDAQRAA